MLSNILLVLSLSAYSLAFPQTATTPPFYESSSSPTDAVALSSLAASATDPVEADITSIPAGFPTIAESDIAQLVEAIPTSILTATDIGCDDAIGGASWFTALPASIQSGFQSFISKGEAWVATATVDGAGAFFSSMIELHVCGPTGAAVISGGLSSSIASTNSGSTTTTAIDTASTTGVSSLISSTVKPTSVSQASAAKATGGMASSFGAIVGALGMIVAL